MSAATFYSRLLEPPQQSFFLFGMRGAGKSTWAQQVFPRAHRFIEREQLQNSDVSWRHEPCLVAGRGEAGSLSPRRGLPAPHARQAGHRPQLQRGRGSWEAATFIARILGP